MYFNSVQYLLFFPAVCLVYFIIPKRLQNVWLLLASYFFYMRWNAGYAILLFGVTGLTYASGMLMERLRRTQREKAAKACLILTVLCALGPLVYYKYSNFLMNSLNGALRTFGREARFDALDVILPVGISFYIFQAIGYAIDVYRGETAERNPIRYALFVSFFPQLTSGPIGRANRLLPQFSESRRLTSENLREGLLYILVGLWMKIVIADNLAGMVDAAYRNYEAYTGVQIALATLLFGIQLYCDFGGYSNMAIGSARILGIRLTQNFNSPYLATSVTDFWRRWHISLTSWFRDYLYIPLGGNRKGTFRKYVNTMIVFLVSGLWHGASWHFVLWGGLNGLLLLLEHMTKADRRPTAAADVWFRRGLTFLLVSVTWFFFRADSLRDAICILQKMVSEPGVKSLLSGSAFGALGDAQTLLITLCAVILLLVLGLIRERHGGNLAPVILRQKPVYRWAFYLALIFAIILYGAYGEQYVQTQFIYFQF